MLKSKKLVDVTKKKAVCCPFPDHRERWITENPVRMSQRVSRGRCRIRLGIKGELLRDSLDEMLLPESMMWQLWG